MAFHGHQPTWRGSWWCDSISGFRATAMSPWHKECVYVLVMYCVCIISLYRVSFHNAIFSPIQAPADAPFDQPKPLGCALHLSIHPLGGRPLKSFSRRGGARPWALWSFHPTGRNICSRGTEPSPPAKGPEWGPSCLDLREVFYKYIVKFWPKKFQCLYKVLYATLWYFYEHLKPWYRKKWKC